MTPVALVYDARCHGLLHQISEQGTSKCEQNGLKAEFMVRTAFEKDGGGNL